MVGVATPVKNLDSSLVARSKPVFIPRTHWPITHWLKERPGLKNQDCLVRINLPCSQRELWPFTYVTYTREGEMFKSLKFCDDINIQRPYTSSWLYLESGHIWVRY